MHKDVPLECVPDHLAGDAVLGRIALVGKENGLLS